MIKCVLIKNFLKKGINNTSDRLNSTQNTNDDLQNNLRGLNDINAQQRDKIAELVDDNKKLAKVCQDQDHSLYLAGQEKQKLRKKLNDDNANLNNLNSKLRIQGNNFNKLQNQLDNSNNLNLKLQNNLKDLDNSLTNYKIDNDNLKQGLSQERACREDEERENNKLRNILNENEKLKEHCMILTRQNQDLSNEIENVIKEDEHMRDVLNRSDRMSSIIKTYDNCICQMPQDIISYSACFDDKRSCIYPENKLSMSQTLRRERTYSPQYTYNRSEKFI